MTDNDNILDEIPELRGIPSLIMVLGVGGAGGNAVNHMWSMGIDGVNLVVCNTDSQDLAKSPVSRKICLGDGLGAGNDAHVGEQKAKISIDEVRHCFESCGTKMLFLAAGMGAGTGTGASPVIAELAAEMGILTVAIVTMPPRNDGPERMNQAREGVERLREHVDSLIVLSNDTISDLYGNLSLNGAFDKANDVVAFATKGIAEIVTRKYNIVNNDFSDVCKVMRDGGCAVMGMATASGDDRAEAAVDAVFSSSLFGNTSIAGAKRVLLNVSVSDESKLTLMEVNRIKDRIQSYASTTDDNGILHPTNIIWGASIKPELGDSIETIIVATGFPASEDYYNKVVDKPETQIRKPLVEQPSNDLTDIKAEKKPLVMQPKSTVPNMIGKPTRNYTEVERRKLTPAFVARKVALVMQTSGARKRAVGRDSDEPNAADNAGDVRDNKLF